MPENNVGSQYPVQPVRRPLLGIVFLYLAGTWAGVWIVRDCFLTGLIMALLSLAIALVLNLLGNPSPSARGFNSQFMRFRLLSSFGPRLATGLICLSILIAGYLAIDLQINSPSKRNLPALMDRPREGVEIIGIVSDDPALRKGWRNGQLYWSFNMRIEALSRVGQFQNARGDVRATMLCNDNEKRPYYGERWRLRGVLVDNLRFAGGDSPLKWSKNRFLFQVDSQSKNICVSEPSHWNLLHWCFVLRQKCADSLALGIGHKPDVVGTLQALVLGRAHELPLNLREAFVATGTYHIFAISGQHVAIIALFVVVVLQAYGVCRLYWFYYLAPILVVFTIMTGMSSSALRGCLMALMCFLGPMLMRKTDIASAMALAALLIVAVDPTQLFQAGFILSFGIVAGLIILCPPLIALTERLHVPDPYRIDPENEAVRNMRSVVRWCVFMAVASCAAWVVSTPLIARWFNLVSLVALPANLIVIPLATLILLAGCVSILFGWWCPFIAEVFNHANLFLVSLTTGITCLLAKVPLGHVYVKAPPLWFVFTWFGFLAVWRVFYQNAKIWLVALLILIIAGALNWRAQTKDWELHVLNVDRCAVCLLTTAEGGTLLLNTGSDYQARSILQYLRKMGVNRLQALGCPVPDPKHIGAAKEIIATLPVRKLWFGAKKQRAKLLNELYLEAETRRIEAGSLTNKVWRVQSGKNGWNITGYCGSNNVVQQQRMDLPANYSREPLTVFIQTGIQTQMTARILIPGGQAPSVIDVEEIPVSGFRKNACFAAPGEAQYRIVCCPITEDRDVNFDEKSFDNQTSIALGQGQGVQFVPDRERVKIKVLSVNP